MSTTVKVELWGGPQDGAVRTLPGALPSLRIPQVGDANLTVISESALPERRVIGFHLYTLVCDETGHPAVFDGGRLRYRYAGEQAG